MIFQDMAFFIKIKFILLSLILKYFDSTKLTRILQELRKRYLKHQIINSIRIFIINILPRFSLVVISHAESMG